MPSDSTHTSTLPLAELLHAIAFAAEKHRSQRRKGEDASPYINHPIAAAELLARYGINDLVTLQAAILHDTLEDTETSPEELTHHFGREVTEVVLEVTDDKKLPKEERKARQISHAPQLSRQAKLVKLADKICNVLDVTHEPPSGWPLERRVGYLDWTEAVVAGCRGVHPELEAFYDRTLGEGRSLLASPPAGPPR